MLRQRRLQEDVSFQLAPMIDMTFLLLIFFMVTTKISKEQVKVDISLPIASNAVIPDDLSNRDLISLDSNGNLYIGSEPTDEASLAKYLRQRLQDYPPLRLYVRADANTPAKRIKKIMTMAAEAGAIDVIFGSYQKP